MVDNSDQRLSPDPEVVELFYHFCNDWGERLNGKLTFTRLAFICQEICNIIGRKTAAVRHGNINLTDVQLSPSATIEPVGPFALELPTTAVTDKLLAHLLDEKRTHSQRKIVSKSYYNLWCQNLVDGAPLHMMWGVQDLGNAEDNSIALYGMLHSRFLTMLQTVPALECMAERNLALFLAPTAGYTRWFNTVSENELTIARTSRGLYGSERHEQMWHVALTNLESPFHGAREDMLALIELLIQDGMFTSRIVRPEWARWSWMDRNKFHLLAILLGYYRWEQVQEPFWLSQRRLGDGLTLSLRYKHLYAGGQTLVRLLYTNQQMTGFVYDLVARVIIREELPHVQTMAKYWFSFFTPKSYRHVYDILQLEETVIFYAQFSAPDHSLPPHLAGNGYEKLFLLVHLFRRQLQSSSVLQPFLVKLCALAETLQPLPTGKLEQLIDTLGHFLIACGATGSIDALQHTVQLTRYVQQAMETPGYLAACRTSVTVCQKLLKHIVTTQQRQLKGPSFHHEAQAHLAKFMSYDMYDRYLLPAGSKPLDYQPTVTALRLFAAFVELFFEFPATSPYVLQMRQPGAVGWIVPLLPDSLALPELGSSFRSMVYGLQHLLRSDFDDIRSIALKMLYNRTVAFNFDPKLQSQLATIHSTVRGGPDKVRASIFHLLDDTVGKLRTALGDHERDFYAAVLAEEENPNSQLHRLIDRCTEVCFGFSAAGDSILNDDDLLHAYYCLDSVCTFMLKVHNSSRCWDRCMIETNFKLLDLCLERLLNQSEEWRNTRNEAADGDGSLLIALAKRKIQLALWKTLRSLAIFFEKHAIWRANRELRVVDGLNIFRQELKSLILIMVYCCHRGAIEATGNSLSRIVRHAVQLKEEAPTILAAVQQVFSQWKGYRPNNADDFRENRGLVWMRHCFLRYDTTDLRDGSLLRDLLDNQLKLGECALYHERGGQKATVEVLWLHQLNLIARETTLNESILPHLDELLIVALSHIRVPVWCIRNAALQLYASCSLKLTGQAQQHRDPDADWPPTYTSFEEVACKATRTIRYMMRQLDGMLQHPPPVTKNNAKHSGKTRKLSPFPAKPFQLLVLQFLSKLEYRGYGAHQHRDSVANGERRQSLSPPPPWFAMVSKLRAILWQMLGHEHDVVRRLAARCFAQLHDYFTEIPALLDPLVYELFTTQGNVNFRHGLCQAILACVQKHVTLCRHMEWDATDRSKQAILERVREMVTHHHEANGMHPPDAVPFRYRSELLKLLLYLGFERDSPVIGELVVNRTAPNAYGQDVLVMQLNQLFNGAVCTVSAAGVVSVDAALIDTGLPHAHQQPHFMPYEISLEWDRDLDILAVEED
uniref:DUF2428 domain-containing protein n=1 Tax=Anopheles christyi TaxID=43041 RepID=A0A182KBP4_9DIPT